jgi:hypothetical protein
MNEDKLSGKVTKKWFKGLYLIAETWIFLSETEKASRLKKSQV